MGWRLILGWAYTHQLPVWSRTPTNLSYVCSLEIACPQPNRRNKVELPDIFVQGTQLFLIGSSPNGLLHRLQGHLRDHGCIQQVGDVEGHEGTEIEDREVISPRKLGR